jgi:hypothetical protein
MHALDTYPSPTFKFLWNSTKPSCWPPQHPHLYLVEFYCSKPSFSLSSSVWKELVEGLMHISLVLKHLFIACSSDPFRARHLPCPSLSYSPPPQQANQKRQPTPNPKLDPVHHRPHFFGYIKPHTTLAPLSCLISPLRIHLTLPRSPVLPLALYWWGEGENLLTIYEEEEDAAIVLITHLPPFLHACAPLLDTNLTLPSSWPRNVGSPTLGSTDGILPTADVQIRISASRAEVPHLVELVVERRAAPSPLRHRGKPPGEPSLPPGRVRVSALLPMARGGRRLSAVDVDFIGRLTPPDTPSASRAGWPAGPSYRRGLNCLPACARADWAGPTLCSLGPIKIWPAAFF